MVIVLPDFGPRGVLDRFSQIAPKLFVTVDGYHYNGKLDRYRRHHCRRWPERWRSARTVVIDVLGRAAQSAGRIDGAVTMEAFLAPFSVEPVRFARLPFSHPLFILFSSGTTGKAKMHRSLRRRHAVAAFEGTPAALRRARGRPGLLLHHLRLDDVELAGFGAGLRGDALLYDGSPFHPEPTQLFDYAEAERFTLFGTSARYLDSVRKLALKPIETHDLRSVRAPSFPPARRWRRIASTMSTAT